MWNMLQNNRLLSNCHSSYMHEMNIRVKHSAFGPKLLTVSSSGRVSADGESVITQAIEQVGCEYAKGAHSDKPCNPSPSLKCEKNQRFKVEVRIQVKP
jgi:hypothetical protein